ncbi:MAG TPA: glycosyltransferase family 2 protein [Patescibacteria group bacterium]
MDLSLIIPNYNGQSNLKDCLTSMATSLSGCPGLKIEVILVDNASSDKSISIFNDFFSKFSRSKISRKVCKLDHNYGFAFAVNYGIKNSKSKWIVVCNNDIVFDPEWFSVIDNAIKKTRDGLPVACYFGTVLNRDGSLIESQGFEYQDSGKCLNICNHQQADLAKLKSQQPSTVWGAPAALVAYNKDIIAKTGYFDENFFAYLEDVDLSFRLMSSGFQTIYLPTAISFHLGGATSSKMGNLRQYYTTRNWYLLLLKNYTKKQILKNFFKIVIERLKNYFWFIRNTNLFKVLPDTVKMISEIIYLIPRLRYTNVK